MPGKHKSEKEKPPIWLVSFGDVTALVLTFFVLLFSMSTFKTNEFIAVTSSLNVSNSTASNINPIPTSDKTIDQSKEIKGLSLNYIHGILSEHLSKEQYAGRVFIEKRDEAIVITMSNDALFVAGKFELSSPAKQLLHEITPALNSFGNQLDIIGHVAPVPHDDALNKSPWDISLLRALTVSREFIKNGYDKKLAVLGSADGYFEDIDKALAPTQRQTLAKRVDIVIREAASGQ